MDDRIVRKLGFLLEQQCRMYAMVAANEACRVRDETPLYDEQHFNALANTIDSLTRE